MMQFVMMRVVMVSVWVRVSVRVKLRMRVDAFQINHLRLSRCEDADGYG